ncbi:MAG: HAMP domain-containing histidine kinase [Clostridia bacterium]|nr:HAMP domain-containing histidine kinase [Clostridia bacterium]
MIILAAANELLLAPFYTQRQKQLLIRQLDVISDMDFSQGDSSTVKLPRATIERLSKISDNYHFEVEIYLENGQILYTSSGSKMMEHAGIGPSFEMQRDEFSVERQEKLSDGTVFEIVRRGFARKEEYLQCRREIGNGMIAEVRIQKQLITSAASTANQLILLIALGCCLVSVVWIFIFARRFSHPVAEMNQITKQLSRLDFSQKVIVSGTDEIAQLGNSVNEMSDSLSSALAELQSANARLRDEIELERQLDGMRRDFVANVSHELKTPIAIISGYAEGLKLNVNENSREEYCNTILEESRRMNRLVLKILDLSRYESGKMELHPENFDFTEMATQMTQRIFHESKITAKVDVPPDTNVFADPLMIEQVLQAYLENARCHTLEGGTVEVHTAVCESGCRLSVTNSGSHVDPEKMPQIWQSFYRGDASHKRDNSRFGLGLSIVSAIAKLHNTVCGVYNTENGVCFWFDIPCK